VFTKIFSPKKDEMRRVRVLRVKPNQELYYLYTSVSTPKMVKFGLFRLSGNICWTMKIRNACSAVNLVERDRPGGRITLS
jgi:hypothetical protein